jgi:hypothetical protein
MPIDFGHRFDELNTQAETILAAKTADEFGRAYIDQNQLINWQVKARHLISIVCGQDSYHLHAFRENEAPQFPGDTNRGILLRQQAILLAVKDDYKGGYLGINHLYLAKCIMYICQASMRLVRPSKKLTSRPR